MKNISAHIREWLRLRRMVRGKRSLNLGTAEPAWPGYVTTGLCKSGPDLCHDATLPFPRPFRGHFDFVWSERMLEHVDCASFDVVFANLRQILRPGARMRFCLPICFFGTPTINMVRAGNEQKCADLGHISWFTHEGFGPVKPVDFGATAPAPGFRTWESVRDAWGFRYEPIRHYDRDHRLFVDSSRIVEGEGLKFTDHPEIVTNRKDSLIFDLVKIH